MNLKVLTFWRFLYILILIVWSIALSANEISNRTEWNNVFVNATTAADNWVHVGSALGLGCGIVVLLMTSLACCFDQGSPMIQRSQKLGRLQRIIFDFACSLASLSIISVSSIYLYVNRNLNKNGEIEGMSWAVILGGVFLVFCILDSLMFKPTMAYMEFMSCLCVSRAVQPKKINCVTNQIEPGIHFMQRYLQGLVPLMPYLGSLGGKDMCFEGMPVTAIIVGPDHNQEMSDKNWYKVAAEALIEHLQNKYAVSYPVANPIYSTNRDK